MSNFYREHREEVEPIREKDRPIPAWMLNPNYTDQRFMKSVGGVTIFLAEGLLAPRGNVSGAPHVEGAHYNHSDTISLKYGYLRVEEAHRAARETIGNDNTAAYYEAMLQCVYEDPTVELQHIIAGIDKMTWFSWQAYGTISAASPAEQ